MRRFSFLLLAPLLLLAVRSPATRGAAAATDLSPAILTANDIPAGLGFSQPHYRLYSHYVEKMKVKTTVKGLGKGTSSCPQPKAFRSAFQQGLIEAFDRASILSAVQVCATLFTDEAATQLAYSRLIAKHLQPALKQGVSILTLPTVGNESTIAGGSQSGLRALYGIFREGDAVVELLYLGPDTYTPDAFATLLGVMDSRLHS